MKIAVFELEPWENQAFETLSEGNQLLLIPEDVRRDQFDERCAGADVISTFVYSDLSAESLQRFKGLKMIATRSTGFDHIDTEYCRRHGIVVSNVPSYADETVAEHVFALLLAISHQVVRAVERTRSGNFSPRGLDGFDLRGRTMGVVGTGSIGKKVIGIARGFQMLVVAFDQRPDEELARSMGFRYLPMDDLLKLSDIITLHVPGNPKTRGMISRPQFEMMKKGAVLINTARGDIVNTQALLEALTNRTIAAAGLDVLPEEPTIREEAELLRSIFVQGHNLETLFAGHMLQHLSNVLITPHSAFNTIEARQRLLDTTVQNIRAFMRGEPHNVVG